MDSEVAPKNPSGAGATSSHCSSECTASALPESHPGREDNSDHWFQRLVLPMNGMEDASERCNAHLLWMRRRATELASSKGPAKARFLASKDEE